MIGDYTTQYFGDFIIYYNDPMKEFPVNQYNGMTKGF
jgi:hypothetical protein